MSNTTDQVTTAEQLASRPDDGHRYELVEGVLRMMSPSDKFSDVEAKVQSWLDAGVRIVLTVDPQNSTVHEYRCEGRIHAYSDGLIDLDDVLTGLQLDVGQLFA